MKIAATLLLPSSASAATAAALLLLPLLLLSPPPPCRAFDAPIAARRLQQQLRPNARRRHFDPLRRRSGCCRGVATTEAAARPPSPAASFASRTAPAATSLEMSSPPASDVDALVDPYASPEVDAPALLRYAVSIAVELSLFAATFASIDYALASFDATLPFPATSLLFYAASLKSRVFNPLNNQRPDRSKAIRGEGEGGSDGGSSPGFRDRVMPSWTPPGYVFPIMWLLIIGPIRAYSSALVVSSTGAFLTFPTMAFALHLAVGDVWNTINNTEKRYGAAVSGVVCVVLSALHAGYQYSLVAPLAGGLLAGTCLWLVTATALIADTWRLNPGANGERVPLYPVRGEAETSFVWFGGGEGGGE